MSGELEVADLSELIRRRRTRIAIAIGFFIIDLVMISFAYILADFINLGSVSWNQSGSMIAVLVPLFALLSINNSAQNAEDVFDIWSGLNRVAFVLVISCGSLLLVSFFLKIGGDFSRIVFVLGGLLSIGFIALGRFAVTKLSYAHAQRGLYAKLCIYDGVPVEQTRESYAIDARALGLSASIDDPTTIGRVGMMAKGMDRIVVHCGPDARQGWALVLKSLDVMSEIVMPELDIYSVLAIDQHNGYSTVVLNSGRLRWGQRLIKRVFDLVLTVIALPIILPVFVVIGILIKLDSSGPIFFKQERIGFGNRAFMMWKFRSMYVERQDILAQKLTERNDPRITRIGAFLRRTSIDELPQIINVVLGDMSLVGPRPHAVLARAGVSLYWEVDPSYWLRHVVKPGITGLAQVSGHRGNTFHEEDLRRRLDADLLYVGSWSLWADILILLRTFRTLGHNNAF